MSRRAGPVIEIRLLAHFSRGGWAKSLISVLTVTVSVLVANNQANLADVTLAVTRVSGVEADTSTVGGSGDWSSVGGGVAVVHAPCGCVEPNTVVTLGGWLGHVVTSARRHRFEMSWGWWLGFQFGCTSSYSVADGRYHQVTGRVPPPTLRVPGTDHPQAPWGGWPPANASQPAASRVRANLSYPVRSLSEIATSGSKRRLFPNSERHLGRPQACVAIGHLANTSGSTPSGAWHLIIS